MLTCADLLQVRDGRRVVVPGVVLARQKPGSAKGVMFITIEDGTGEANLLLWPNCLEKQRRLVLLAGMIACHGKVQREGDVTHAITDRLEDLSDLLRSVRERDEAFPLTHGRWDGATHPRPGTCVKDQLAGRSGTSTSPTYAWGQGVKSRRRHFGNRCQPPNRWLW